ncbi:HAD superfamily hydrolase [Trichophyton equinum CBS 127.97]|uniref:HAD superfamily hydrolase n=1 Tax=Trichophyton equinum (strain ATCC MYA-4606 / CBS 127.97) TaxID=559882 RepID=F2PJH7_TRIEC|nr:HAD superfamily hydrolase [Trichophyton equinum CBS 127.97]
MAQRRFAPLDTDGGDVPVLKGIVFDVDGTLWQGSGSSLPQHYMFQEMRDALGIEKGVDIIHHIRGLPTFTARTDAIAIVRDIERKAMVKQVPQPGLVELMDYLNSKNVKRALCTRNFDGPVNHLIKSHLATHVFAPIITRDTPNIMPKPDPAGILHIARAWELEDASGLIMVGDSLDDMTAGHKAGAATVLLLNERNQDLKDNEHTDLCIERLDELINVLETGFCGTRERP